MRGLIRNNFYSMEGNLKFTFLLSGIFLLLTFIVREPTALTIIVSVQIFSFIANTGTSLRADEVSEWNKFERTLPLKQNTVIKAKYISFGFLIICGFIMGLLTGGITIVLAAGTLKPGSLMWGYTYGLTLSFITAAIMYPAMLKVGTEKNELFVLIGALITVMYMFLIAALLSPLTGGMDLRSVPVGIVSICSSLLLFVISYFISLRIYKNKEF